MSDFNQQESIAAIDTALREAATAVNDALLELEDARDVLQAVVDKASEVEDTEEFVALVEDRLNDLVSAIEDLEILHLPGVLPTGGATVADATAEE